MCIAGTRGVKGFTLGQDSQGKRCFPAPSALNTTASGESSSSPPHSSPSSRNRA